VGCASMRGVEDEGLRILMLGDVVYTRKERM